MIVKTNSNLWLFVIAAVVVALFCPKGADAETAVSVYLPFHIQPAISLDQAFELYEQQQYEQAAAYLSAFILFHPKTPERGRAFTMLGASLLQSEHFEEAAASFYAASQSDKAMADVAALYRIKALKKAGKPADALEALDDFSARFPMSTHSDELEEFRASLLFDAGEFKKSADLWLNLAGNDPDYGNYTRCRLEAAKALIAAKDEKLALIVLRNTLLRATPGRYTEQVIDLYADTNGGGFDSALHTVALNWLDDGYHRQAAPIVRDLLKVRRTKSKPGDAALQELIGKLAYGLFLIHANEESLALYKEISADRSAEDRPHSLYRIAKILTRMGDNAASQKVFEQILKEHPSSGYAPAARYQLALIDMEDNRYKKAYQYFSRRIKKPASNMEYLIWLAAWTGYRSGQRELAAGHLDTLISKYRRSRDWQRYRYWRARIHAEKKETQKAIEIYRSINAAEPLTYYGFKSYEELKSRKLSGRSVKSVFQTKTIGGPPLPKLDTALFDEKDKSRIERILTMTQLDMADEAVRELRFMTDSYGEEKNLPAVYGICSLLQENGDYNKAKWLARNYGLYSYCKQCSAPIGQAYFSFSYPAGFSKYVKKWGTERKLPLELVYGLMLAESDYRSKVISPAFAIGLMQIVPRTGREIAQDLNVRDFETEDLFDPAINVSFGTWYLRKMLDRFDGKAPYAIASYNAGPDVVSKWVRNKGDLPDEIFIEEIPYSETNRYVKKVSTFMEIYKALYDI